MKKISQSALLFEYFKKNPRRDIPHPEIVDWATAEHKKRTGEVFRDPDRAIRKMHQEGTLIKVRKGIYRYDPEVARKRSLYDFDQKTKEAILKRDEYRCVVCGRGAAEGVELHVDHIKPKDKGGNAILENGQTLCARHNFQKKNLKQTETGKKMFIRLYDLAKSEKDEELQKFCKDILDTYDQYQINGHIDWKK